MSAGSGGAGSWERFCREAPEFAEQVRAAFGVRKHATMATLRADGSPRISGTEVEIGDEGVFLGSMPGALKARDLLRDPRVAVHAPTVDPPEDDPSAWAGEAKLAGRAVLVPTPADMVGAPDSHRFRLELTEVVHTCVEADQLVVSSWHPGRGVEVRRRS